MAAGIEAAQLVNFPMLARFPIAIQLRQRKPKVGERFALKSPFEKHFLSSCFGSDAAIRSVESP
jgi:hypothetical protein